MGYCYIVLEGQFEKIESDNEAIQRFEEKWKNIIKLFEGNFFVKNELGDYYLFCLPSDNLTINSRNFPTLDNGKPNIDRALAKFFSNIKKSQGDCDFGFGTPSFSDKFYIDLYNLCKAEYSWSVLSADCGDDGYYTGSFTLIDNGIYEIFDFIEYDE
jgi:hypothetical protein